MQADIQGQSEDDPDYEPSFDDDPTPIDVQALMARAFDLAELNEVGAVFPYPDTLTSEEWLALRTLQAGRRRYLELEQERQKAEATEREQQQRLDSILGRRN